MTLMQVIILSLPLLFISFDFSVADESLSSFTGQQYCIKGQVAWCQNFSTAVECNSVKHCVQSVWLTQKLPFNIGSCSSCESEIEKIRQGIGSNTTKEVIKELLENICDLTFITELFRKRCERYIDNYVDSYFNEILDLLKSDIDAATICHILGFCVNDELNKPNHNNSVVHYQNVILHLPNTSIINIPKSKELLGSVKCTWGPSYWCNNITSSKECKSTSHCIFNVWQKEKYYEDNDYICKICKDMVKQTRNQLQSNKTQIELREVFKSSCKLILIEQIQKDCFKLADQFVQEFTEMLVSEMSPAAVCTVSGLCNNEYIDKLLMTTISLDLCTNCSVALTAVQQYLHRTPHNLIRDKFLQLCNQFSSFSEICSNLIKSNFIDINNFLLKKIEPFPICHISDMCTRNYHFNNVEDDITFQNKMNIILSTAKDNLPCDLCKQLVKHFKEVLTTNTTEDEFLEVLQGICKQTGKFKEDCLDIVKYNFEKIYKFLTEELDPLSICSEVDLCPKSKMVTDENMNLISNYSSPIIILAEDDAKVPYLPSVQKPVDDVECQICKKVVQILQQKINKFEYEHNTEKLLSEICSSVPFNNKKCEKFVQSYGDSLIKILDKQTDPNIMCSMLDSCLNYKASLEYNNELCPICQYVLHFIQEELEKPEEQQKVEDVVRKICKFVPKSEVTECESFISDYAALIISILSQEMDPSLVCPALKLCPNFNSQDESCSQCQYLMVSLISKLDDNHSKNNILSALNATIPRSSNLTLTALQLKTLYTEDIIEMINADFDAQESCTFLHFCNAEMLSVENTINIENDIPESNDILSTTLTQSSEMVIDKPSCELCELLVQIYEDKLTSNYTEEEIELELQKFCNKIQNVEFHSNCSHFINKFVPKIVQLLKQNVQLFDVCYFVKICPSNARALIIENGNECELCEAVTESFENLISTPGDIQQSIVKLIQICEIYDEKDRSQCMKVISYIAPQLESITLKIPSWYYCSKINMCPYGASLTYKKVCNNQSKWCVNVQTAILCNKLTYCQLNLWRSKKPSL